MLLVADLKPKLKTALESEHLLCLHKRTSECKRAN